MRALLTLLPGESGLDAQSFRCSRCNAPLEIHTGTLHLLSCAYSYTNELCALVPLIIWLVYNSTLLLEHSSDGSIRLYRVDFFDGAYYCIQCHRNELAVIPSRIFNNWDFSKYPGL